MEQRRERTFMVLSGFSRALNELWVEEERFTFECPTARQKVTEYAVVSAGT
jgi:hypothetical protein